MIYNMIYMYNHVHISTSSLLASFLSHPLSNGTVSAFAKQLNEAHWKFRRGIHHILDPSECSTMNVIASSSRSASDLPKVGFQRIIATSDSP